MSLVATNIKGEILLLQYIVGMVSAGNPVLQLYPNDVTPSHTTVIADLGTMPGGVGYTPITLTSSQWTTTQVSGVTTAIYSEVTFTFNTGATAFGYFVTNITGDLLWVERFTGAPFDIPTGGGTISITTKLTLS